MPAIADLERLLERVFERTTARIFRARIQVVQVERKVERAMERARTPQGTWTLVPSRYRVRLEPADLMALAADAGSPEALAGTLADAALSFARAHGYHLAGRPSVALVADPAVERGTVEVDAVGDIQRPTAGTGAAASRTPAPVPDVPVVPARAAVVELPVANPSPPGLSAPPAAATAAADAPIAFDAPPYPQPVAALSVATIPDLLPDATAGGIRGDGTQTMVFRRPVPQATRAQLRVIAPGGTERTIEVDGTPLTLGRSSDNVLVLADSRVSRHHGRLQARRGTLVYTDLASTNGSRVNGIRVDECALGIGDRILVGDTVLLVESLPG